MKRTTFKIRNRVNNADVLQEVIAEEYDKLTYYVSPKMNKNFKFPYSIYDKKTGLMVCAGKTKQELIDKYNDLNESYARARGREWYKKCIEQYEQLKKEENKNV